MSFGRLFKPFTNVLSPTLNVLGLAGQYPKTIATQTFRFFSAKTPPKAAEKKSSFHFSEITLPPSPIAGTGSIYNTKLPRKREITNISKPNFVKIERLKWATWGMLRDVRRRHIFVNYWPIRLSLLNIRKCKMLPNSVQESAFEDLATQLPRDSRFQHLRNRCVITGRSRGVLKRYRLSRLCWRDLADNNRLSGVSRACW